jgi:hypothetical protein
MEKNGSTMPSASPWDLLVAVPDNIGGAPVITTSDFTLAAGFPEAFGPFLPTTPGSIYDFTSTTGDSSMNASNMFGASEVAAFGGTPTFLRSMNINTRPRLWALLPPIPV